LPEKGSSRSRWQVWQCGRNGFEMGGEKRRNGISRWIRKEPRTWGNGYSLECKVARWEMEFIGETREAGKRGVKGIKWIKKKNSWRGKGGKKQETEKYTKKESGETGG